MLRCESFERLHHHHISSKQDRPLYHQSIRALEHRPLDGVTSHQHNVVLSLLVISYHTEVSWNRDTPKSSTLMGFFHYKLSILGFPIYGNPHMYSHEIPHCLPTMKLRNHSPPSHASRSSQRTVKASFFSNSWDHTVLII